MYWMTYSKSICGKREVNQDDFAALQSRGVKAIIVCDGNGCKDAEKLAQEIVKTSIGEISYALLKMGKVTSEKLKDLGLSTVRRSAEQALMLKNHFKHLSSAGTTITLILIHGCTVFAFWVGDSPAMIYQNGRILRLTDPLHNLKEMLISEGLDKESISMQHGLSSVLMRCIGHSECEPDFKIMEMKTPFLVLAASDGIANLPEKKLLGIVKWNLFDKNLPDKIVNASLEAGSDDNITVVSVLVLEMRKKLGKIKRLYWKRRRLIC